MLKLCIDVGHCVVLEELIISKLSDDIRHCAVLE